MKYSKWILVLNTLKTIAFFIWIFATISSVFNWFKTSALLTASLLETLKYLGIVLYLIFHLFELRITLKLKNVEIAKLKTRLLQYEQ
ncbi:hypothetical protein [uncultured Winogradskyella sp.]|uniref:hypothetical protein n=1 Tax=uncultured Winogradskyella sp. TaxID=395353 RepID=UPI0030D788EB|tara:strand:+ start:72484 stop:72744 length:261 start_codon:yes stop_codon:yes gene_type:complete